MNTMRMATALVLMAGLLRSPILGAQTLDSAVVTVEELPRPIVRRPISIEDMRRWKSIRGATLSAEGNWFAYQTAEAEGDAVTTFRKRVGGQEHNFPVGDSPAPTITFSADEKWAVFAKAPTHAETVRLRQQRRPVQQLAALLELATGQVKEFERVRSYGFSGKRSSHLAVHLLPAVALPSAGGTRALGSDLVLVDLASGEMRNIGNVAEFAFDSTGDRLFYTVDATDRVGNAVVMRDLRSGSEKLLDARSASYRSLRWSEKNGGVLLAVRSTPGASPRDSTVEFVLFSNLQRSTPAQVVYAPLADPAFPAGMTLSTTRAPYFTEDLSGIYFSVQPSRGRADSAAGGSPDSGSGRSGGAPPLPADERPDLVIWHYLDPRLQRQQEIEETRDRSVTYLMLYWQDEKKLVQLTDSTMPTMIVPPKDRWGLALDTRAHELQGNLDGHQVADLYIVDLKTGERRAALKRIRNGVVTSPDGGKFLFFSDGHYYAYDIVTGTSRNITEDVAASFVDDEDDHNTELPPRPVIDWASDSRSVLISDGWDIWNVPIASGRAVNLTVNGKLDSVRYRTRLFRTPDDRGVDLKKPFFVSAYGEWTKQEGVARVEASKPGARMTIWDDAHLAFSKARYADVFFYTRETFVDFPDYYIAAGSPDTGVRVTDANPRQEEFLWSDGARLIDYTSAKGKRLQGALYLPANALPGEKYPLVVYVYERLSQNLHRYSAPDLSGAFNPTNYTSRGYAVLLPDIAYELNDPGMSAVWCVLPAVDAAVATGMIDSERMGLHGHSWGGYEAAFLITQTNIFRAAVAGAPLTNLVSMYSSIYWNSGSMNAAIFEASQGRFTGAYWENDDAYIRNSPVFQATKVETPLLIMHNDQDGAVNFNQGVEFYNTLRRMGKAVVMLQYVGENHSLLRAANQKDYSIRMREFFDHYLKAAPSPDWWEDGVPRVLMDQHLRERASLLQPPRIPPP